MSREYRFRIGDAFTPATLPMARLAEYVAALASLLGETESVHFKAVERGSAVLVADVDEAARSSVTERIRAVRDGKGPKEALRAYRQLDDMLRRDRAVGALESDDEGVLVQFPGYLGAEPLVFGPFRQDGTLDGQVIRVGGKDDAVPVHLRDGERVHTGLVATREMARRLGPLIFGPTIRVYGVGNWSRTGDGTWALNSFKIADFEILDDAPLAKVVQGLREVEGNRWNEVPDPIRALIDERQGDGDPH